MWRTARKFRSFGVTEPTKAIAAQGADHAEEVTPDDFTAHVINHNLPYRLTQQIPSNSTCSGSRLHCSVRGRGWRRHASAAQLRKRGVFGCVDEALESEAVAVRVGYGGGPIASWQ